MPPLSVFLQWIYFVSFFILPRMSYLALAFYEFVSIENPHLEVKKHKKFFKNREITCRIYLSEEGVNGQLSGSAEDVDAYIEWIKADPRFESTHFKLGTVSENIFPRVSVKYRKELVALSCEIEASEGGEHVDPKRWKEMLESGDYLVLDVRNEYESEIGHFEGAVRPSLKTFREFPKFAEKLAAEKSPKETPVMMYCTGGIRCEVYSKVLKDKGFNQVYQLNGGVINYGHEVGKDHWRGKLFVFDDRLAIEIDGDPSEPIAQCHHCGCSSDTQYNCANMDCNHLFVSCSVCTEKELGCCSTKCMRAPRRRPYQRENGNKPFRKKHLLASTEPDRAPASLS